MDNDDLETSEHLDDNDDLASETGKSPEIIRAPVAHPPVRNKTTNHKKKKRQSKEPKSGAASTAGTAAASATTTTTTTASTTTTIPTTATTTTAASEGDGPPRKKPRKKQRAPVVTTDPSAAAQQAVNEQMRRVLEEDRYSAAGSIVDEPDSDVEDYLYRGQPIRLDRSALAQAMKKYMAREQRLFRLEEEAAATAPEAAGATSASSSAALSSMASGGGPGGHHSKKKGKRKEDNNSNNNNSNGHNSNNNNNNKSWVPVPSTTASPGRTEHDPLLDDDVDLDRDGGSIFGQTTGSSNSTWVECDKCKKWRRLRGVVDEKKLPKQWFCSMNKSDPERSRCSAPEEEYNDTVQTQSPESLADMRARKHLRVWVRRLQCNEAYEARQPTLTRGKKRASSSSAKDPYEWIRCCNPACGKWRAILRFMDAKANVMDRARDGEWYCVMNTWDEKMASCAAPQENLPAIGCPPWVMQDTI